MDTLLERMHFEVSKQTPEHLPAITQSVVILSDYKDNSSNTVEKHIKEMKLIDNLTKQIKGRENSGGNEGKGKI